MDFIIFYTNFNTLEELTTVFFAGMPLRDCFGVLPSQAISQKLPWSLEQLNY